ncbi:phosphatidylinositol transfer protein 2-like isoform X1 [Carya illinoinensis]|uniref:phosphatidylinositol transfer protein 2-like isoform X1 n=1 Tax=Carya illinoinensis TaxID=32201 RepID=UPI001C7196A5|nr:phosphatidylinositol transfer protein 2-like isoform X1 [Carya illinoinensis]
MPVSLEEYGIAQMYIVTKMQQKNTTSTEGIEVLESRPFEDNVYGTGQYTSLSSAKQSSFLAYESCTSSCSRRSRWNAYPRCKSVLKISRKWTHHITTLLFFGFGLWSLWDGFTEEGEAEELAEVGAKLAFSIVYFRYDGATRARHRTIRMF